MRAQPSLLITIIVSALLGVSAAATLGMEAIDRVSRIELAPAVDDEE